MLDTNLFTYIHF